MFYDCMLKKGKVYSISPVEKAILLLSRVAMIQISSFELSKSSTRMMYNSKRCLTAVPFLLFLLVLPSCVADIDGSKVQSKPLAPAVVILGDSTVDVGVNNYLFTIIKCNWPPYGRDFVYENLTKTATGRFCNGKLISDFLTEKVGLPYALAHGDPLAKGINILYGINTASSGTGWYDGTAALYNVAGLTEQLSWVKEWQHDLVEVEGLNAAANRVKEAMYIVSTGSNDWVNNYYSNVDLQSRFSKTAYRQVLLDNVVNHITTLYGLGARKIAVVSLPPLGCLPSQMTLHGNGVRTCVHWIQDDARAFNEGMNEVIANLSTALKESTLVILDAFTLIYDASTNPARYGIAKSDKGCCATGLYETGIFCNALSETCEDASQYLFWDSYHPTESFNRQAADIFWDVMKGPFGFGTRSKPKTTNEVPNERDEL